MLEFPHTDHMLLNALWRQQIKPLFGDVLEAKVIVDRHRQPTKDEIETYIAKSDDPHIVKGLKQLGQMEREIALIRDNLDAIAREALHSPANEDERKAARQKFNRLKNSLVASLHSLGHVAASEGEQDVVDWVNTALENVPRLSTSPSGESLREMRKWLRAHHPEANIKSRGTIPLKWKQVYYNRTE